MSDLSGKRVLVMGLGAHGGGAATARFCVEADAEVTVTDLRSEADLGDSLSSLRDLNVRYVLGEHRERDFTDADIVLKNPAVPRSSPFLQLARRVETDISLFLGRHAGPVCAITGTKGKSTTATALHHILSTEDPTTRLGGNITVSPLTFSSELSGTETVVLELSSFQLGDLLLTPAGRKGVVPRFGLVAVTNVLPDHQDYYACMEDYAADKAIAFRNQDETGWVLLSADDQYSRGFQPANAARTVRMTSGPLEGDVQAGFVGSLGCMRCDLIGSSSVVELVPERVRVAGNHQRTNLLTAGVAATILGMDPETVRSLIAEFPGVPHRLEFLGSIGGIDYYNDSAATIAEAALAALNSFDRPVHMIAGGSDKGLPLHHFAQIGRSAASLHLLAGSATDRIITLPGLAGNRLTGPHDTLEAAVTAAVSAAAAGDIILLSPGCASFGMFRNEFDRGDQFRSLVRRI